MQATIAIENRMYNIEIIIEGIKTRCIKKPNPNKRKGK